MNNFQKNIILSLSLLLSTVSSAYATQDSLLEPNLQPKIHHEYKTNTNNSYFNLANIVDSFLSNETTIEQNIIDDKSKIRKDFLSITSKFNQGNALVAYDEYEKLIEKIENDTSLLTLSKILYEIGFFSLGNKAIEKIIYKNQFFDNISDLEKCYLPKVQPTKEQEIYYAKLYSSIYFDNSASEVVSELNAKKQEILKNDYAQFMLSRANFEQKNYSQALSAINKAISINPNNISYKVFKVDVLIGAKKFKDANSEIEKIKKTKPSINFADDLEIKKETVLANITSNKERKYHIANKSFLEGNFEKTKKDCQNIINFDKENDKIVALYAKSELALKNIERANVHFVNAYKLEKNNLNTIIGLGDIRFLHGDYKNSVKMYKKARKIDKKNYEVLIKLTNAQREYAKNQKELKKLEIQLDKMPKSEYIAYYKSAISIAQKNSVLKEDYLKKALNINPMYENALGELIELHLKNKNFQLAKGLIYNASFTLERNYYYYYLCGLYNQAMNKKQNAIQFYKTSLSLNPNFEIANIKLLKLIPDTTNEEI